MTTGRSKKIVIAGERELHIREDDPVEWFEDLYGHSDTGGAGVPWASMQTHASFATWLQTHELAGANRSALVVGCGMGDDAMELRRRGFGVTAFDASASAINLCKKRFPGSGVEFVQADLFDPPAQWTGQFDFVLEIYTVQAVPPTYEDKAITNIAEFVAPGGQLVVIAEVGVGERSFDEGPPWLLTPQHVDHFVSRGLCVEDRSVGQPSEGGSTNYVTTFGR